MRLYSFLFPARAPKYDIQFMSGSYMIREQFDLTGKKGIVTGASRGLGRAMAFGLAGMGADLALAARSGEDLKETAREIIARNDTFNCTILPVVTDVSDDNSIKHLVEITVDKLGGIDFVLCNAGIIRRFPAIEHPVEEFDEILRINVHSTFVLAQLAAQKMIEQKRGGSIVIVDSVVSQWGSRNIAGYSSSKGALNSLIRTLANEWGIYGIRVNGIGPGIFETPMTELHRNDPERSKAMLSRIALGRWGKPEDLEGVAVFLASDASRYITGKTIFVDGGFLSM
jgi:2-dehydro-3-deoxy-D-gluconate 5-dehydrogenase